MAASGGAGKAAQTVQDLLANPYVRRAMEDPAVRDNARVAYESARQALDRAKGSENFVNALFDDRKLQEQLAATGRGIAIAREHLIVRPKRKRRVGRAILVVVVGAGLAIALSEGLRNKVLDVLFGAEEEFDYVSTTAPPAPAPAAAATPAAATPAADEPAGEPQASAEPVAAEPVAKVKGKKAEAAAEDAPAEVKADAS
jgi:hypothetical protein